MDLVALVGIYSICRVSRYGRKKQLVASLDCKWAVWFWWEANWSVRCIFFHLCSVPFVYTSDSSECLLYFRTSAKAFQKKLFFTFKNKHPERSFHNATFPKGDDLKISSMLFQFYENKYFSLLVKKNKDACGVGSRL